MSGRLEELIVCFIIAPAITVIVAAILLCIGYLLFT